MDVASRFNETDMFEESFKSRDGFLDYLEYLELHMEDENEDKDAYEIIIGWDESKTLAFMRQFDWNFNYFDAQVYEFDEEYLS